MANSHVGHDCHVGDDVTFANGVRSGGHVEIGDGVIFGGLAAVQQFCRVGTGAMVGGLTGVTRDVIPYAMAFGDHVRLGGLNLIGLKRRGLSRDTINALRGAFRAIFLDGNGSIDSDDARSAQDALARRARSGRDRRFHPGRRQAADLSGPQRGADADGDEAEHMERSGIIAGGGDLPRAVAESAQERGSAGVRGRPARARRGRRSRRLSP